MFVIIKLIAAMIAAATITVKVTVGDELINYELENYSVSYGVTYVELSQEEFAEYGGLEGIKNYIIEQSECEEEWMFDNIDVEIVSIEF